MSPTLLEARTYDGAPWSIASSSSPGCTAAARRCSRGCSPRTPRSAASRERACPRTRASICRASIPRRKEYGGPGAVRLRARVAPHRELAARLRGERAEAVRGVVAALGPLAPAAAREVAAEPAQDAVPAGALPRLRVRGRRPPPDPRLDPDREVARHASLRPDVRALAPLPRAVRGRPRAPRSECTSSRTSSWSATRRACCAGSSSSSSSTRSRRASPSRAERTRSTSGQWQDLKRDLRMRAYLDLVSLWYERRVRRYGYSLLSPERAP